MQSEAIVKSSNRTVPIIVEGDEFFVVRPRGRNDAWHRWMYRPPVHVAGPFKMNDERFVVKA